MSTIETELLLPPRLNHGLERELRRLQIVQGLAPHLAKQSTANGEIASLIAAGKKNSEIKRERDTFSGGAGQTIQAIRYAITPGVSVPAASAAHCAMSVVTFLLKQKLTPRERRIVRKKRVELLAVCSPGLYVMMTASLVHEYLLTGDLVVKIGKAENDISKRLAGYNTGELRPYILLRRITGMEDVDLAERNLHLALAPRRASAGELFRVSNLRTLDRTLEKFGDLDRVASLSSVLRHPDYLHVPRHASLTV